MFHPLSARKRRGLTVSAVAAGLLLAAAGLVSPAANAAITGAPTITEVWPNTTNMGGGYLIRIYGTNFEPGMTVDIGGSDCAIQDVLSENRLTCINSSGVSGLHAVNATNSQGTGSLAAGFYYNSGYPPMMMSFTPYQLTIGTEVTVTIRGEGFTGTSGSMKFDGQSLCPSLTIVSTQEMNCTFTVPSGATAGVKQAILSMGGGYNRPGAVEYVAASAPALIESVTPTQVSTAGGETLTFTGNFTANSAIFVGGQTCTPLTLVNATTVTCPAPAHPVGAVDVEGEEGVSRVSLTNMITYVSAVPNSVTGNLTATIDAPFNTHLARATVNIQGTSLNVDRYRLHFMRATSSLRSGDITGTGTFQRTTTMGYRACPDAPAGIRRVQVKALHSSGSASKTFEEKWLLMGANCVVIKSFDTPPLTLTPIHSLVFPDGSSYLSTGNKRILSGMSPGLRETRFLREVKVVAYTDGRLTDPAAKAANWELATARARAVQRHLLSFNMGYPIHYTTRTVTGAEADSQILQVGIEGRFVEE